MSDVKRARQAHAMLARAEAAVRLKRGDRLRVTRCGGLVITVTFAGEFDGYWVICRPRLRDHVLALWRDRRFAHAYDDVSPINITHVNGWPVQFGGPRP